MKWTKDHKREGMALALELFAAHVRGGGDLDKLDEEVEAAGFPQAWQPRSLLSYALDLDAKTMRRGLQKIRALAEGRMVRETLGKIRWRDGSDSVPEPMEDVRREVAMRREGGYSDSGRVVRVTRIRRVSR
jgi:hypothetical protein